MAEDRARREQTRAELEADALPAELDSMARAELEPNSIKTRPARLRSSDDMIPWRTGRVILSTVTPMGRKPE